MENTRNIFSINLRRIIDDKGLKYADAAEQLEISVAFLSNLMRNKGTPSLEMIYQIAEKLGVRASDLFADPNEALPISRSDLIVDIIKLVPTLDEDKLRSILRLLNARLADSSPAMPAAKLRK